VLVEQETDEVGEHPMSQDPVTDEQRRLIEEIRKRDEEVRKQAEEANKRK
jgi:hypothetical protein